MSQARKVYIFAPAASGKSTFNKQYQNYKGFQIVDFAFKLPKISFPARTLFYLSRIIPQFRKLARKSKSFLGPKEYFEKIFSYLRTEEHNLLVFGRRPPADLSPYDDIEFALILIPEEQHRRNCESRKKQMRNPLPFMHHWTTDFEKVKNIRKELQQFASERNIPIYDSFKGAVEAIALQSNDKRNKA